MNKDLFQNDMNKKRWLQFTIFQTILFTARSCTLISWAIWEIKGGAKDLTALYSRNFRLRLRRTIKVPSIFEIIAKNLRNFWEFLMMTYVSKTFFLDRRDLRVWEVEAKTKSWAQRVFERKISSRHCSFHWPFCVLYRKSCFFCWISSVFLVFTFSSTLKTFLLCFLVFSCSLCWNSYMFFTIVLLNFSNFSGFSPFLCLTSANYPNT